MQVSCFYWPWLAPIDKDWEGANAVVECAGEEETDLDVGDMVRKGEVAWLNAEEMKAAAEPSTSAYSAPENGESRASQHLLVAVHSPFAT